VLSTVYVCHKLLITLSVPLCLWQLTATVTEKRKFHCLSLSAMTVARNKDDFWTVQNIAQSVCNIWASYSIIVVRSLRKSVDC